MARFLIRRFILMFIALYLIATVTWIMMQFLPGSPFNDEKLSPEALAMLEAKYGLDDPLWRQYLGYIGNMLQGDLGISYYFNGTPVTTLLIDRFPVSVFLGAEALIIGIPVGLVLGVLAALKHNSLLDTTTTLIAVGGISIPNFVIGPLLQYTLGLKLGIFPVAEWGGFMYSVLPALTLSVFSIAIVARYMRAEMLEVFGQDYVTLAQAKGLTRLQVITRHVLRNSLIPIVTVIPPLMINIITGSLVVENIFAVPGIGDQFVQSIFVNDYGMIMGTTMLYAVLFVAALLVQDLLYGVIDPRIRVAGGSE